MTNAGRAGLFGFAPQGVCLAWFVAAPAVGSYPAISPLPVPRVAPGGIFSVALSVGSLRPAVNWPGARPLRPWKSKHPGQKGFFWSPDFPLRQHFRSSGTPAHTIIYRICSFVVKYSGVVVFPRAKQRRNASTKTQEYPNRR